ncbi:hypothetical protein SAMN05444410_101342 [Hydrobacter penzbergensis]|uniref:Uncharacterized protein n=1 Tax=Hydrobacter penzbergensis TaxID=1235997 RepID=A0A8X8L9W4_9BACT|nr:hypothetical protein [Hydrobacter penzbergensis]SDW14576.1 hypothetical protein SAMN05444410_101342 [Hydrobacter penzbergensis]
MKANRSIQLKAAFLLVVFSLNTVIGFACSVGMDLGFNTTHHHDEATQSSIHVHADGKKHQHHHQHNHKAKNHSQAHHEQKSKDDKDNCCNDGVTKFAQLEKTVPQSVNAVINPVFFAAFLSTYFDIDLLFASQVVPNIKHFVRSYHPPISDIRIAIQSFQI